MTRAQIDAHAAKMRAENRKRAPYRINDVPAEVQRDRAARRKRSLGLRKSHVLAVVADEINTMPPCFLCGATGMKCQHRDRVFVVEALTRSIWRFEA